MLEFSETFGLAAETLWTTAWMQGDPHLARQLRIAAGRANYLRMHAMLPLPMSALNHEDAPNLTAIMRAFQNLTDEVARPPVFEVGYDPLIDLDETIRQLPTIYLSGDPITRPPTIQLSGPPIARPPPRSPPPPPIVEV